MKVLLACPGIFDQIGGGQRFYASLIRNNPKIDFFCFGNAVSGADVPQNVHFIQPVDVHRSQSSEFRLDEVGQGNPAEPLKRHADELALLLDLAASVPPMPFDVVDIPDFLPLAVYFPECLKYFGCEFEKVALSMHGTLSMGLLDNWDEALGDLSSLTEHEELLYRYCDLRYGIGRQYIADWQQSCGLPAQLLDIGKIYDVAPAARGHPGRAAAPDAPPDLCFVGRQEKWKGPDLLLELCSRLPRDAFGEIRLCGPSVNIHGQDSMTVLRRLARHRSLDLVHEVVDPQSIAQRMREERMVVVLPSRRDTFNLVAIETLLSGCPAVVSSRCGVCDFLDTAYPGIPYVKIDPDDLMGSYDDILALLTDYDAARAALGEYLKTAKPRDYGATLGPIYATEEQPDPAARATIEERFRALTRWLGRGFLHRAERASAASAVERCSAVLSSYHCDTIAPALAETEFSRAVDIVRIWQESRPNSAGTGWAAVDRALDRLNGHVFGGSRVNTYRLMAEWERARGNDLLYATYWLRVMRLSGRITGSVLREVRSILAKSGFSEMAVVAGMLHRNDDDEIYDYLDRRSSLFRTPPSGGLTSAVEIGRPAAPKISVIVSVYNGADKINTFVSGIERFTTEEKSIAEFIFVDSASADDTGQLLPERLKLATGRGIGALYLRTEQRETIQRAWNRGIAAARGEYLAFLGLDEMNRPDSLAKMAAFLDRRHDIDWVQGSAVMTEVNKAGSYVRDVMAYDRTFDSQHIHYLECCYVSYVGALYRKAIHDRVGLYDDEFRAAGDTEFKNRALPFIGVHTLPETLGTFLNYPEARTTQSPAAELEDLGAWYLHRTPGGVRYALEARDPADCLGQFRRALHYKKSYMDRVCTDVEYAWSVAEYLRRDRPDTFSAIEHFVPNLLGLRLAYQRLDDLANPDLCPGAKGFGAIGGALEHVWFGIAQAHSVHRLLGLPAQYQPSSDNRWHQHHTLWPSTTRRAPADSQAADEAPAADRQAADRQAADETPAVPSPLLPMGSPPARLLEEETPAPTEAASDPFEIDLSRPIGGSGWHQPESSGGSWYRWTGPEPRFTLEILLPRLQSYQCEMVMAPVRADVFDDFSVTVNNSSVAYTEEWQDTTIRLSFPIISSLIQSSPDFCQIAFRHKTVYSPGEDGSKDARRLGFAVRSISFLPRASEAERDILDDGDAPRFEEAGLVDGAGLPDSGLENGAAGAPGFDMTIAAVDHEPPTSAPPLSAGVIPKTRPPPRRKARTRAVV